MKVKKKNSQVVKIIDNRKKHIEIQWTIYFWFEIEIHTMFQQWDQYNGDVNLSELCLPALRIGCMIDCHSFFKPYDYVILNDTLICTDQIIHFFKPPLWYHFLNTSHDPEQNQHQKDELQNANNFPNITWWVIQLHLKYSLFEKDVWFDLPVNRV